MKRTVEYLERMKAVDKAFTVEKCDNGYVLRGSGIDVHDSQNSAEELQKIKSIVIQNYPQLLTGSIIKNPKGR